MTQKVDVCVNFYGKPYQTAVTLKSLWKHSAKHINHIYVTIEKVQPHNDYGGAILIQHLLKDLPVIYYTPKYFYALGTPPEELLGDPEHRYALNFQYGIEKTDRNFMFISHNDCLYNDDLLGKMLARAEKEDYATFAGLGLIGQCWNCPALSARVCDNTRFETYVPTALELSELVKKYNPPRAKIHEELIAGGYIHPLPECRLNEHACLINTKLYNQNVRPKGDVLPCGGNWNGTDIGTIWFYEMYNLGYKFVNFPFEPDMIHAPFAASASGTKSDKNLNEYQRIETQALDYLKENGFYDSEPVSLQLQKSAYFFKSLLKNKLAGVLSKK